MSYPRGKPKAASADDRLAKLLKSCECTLVVGGPSTYDPKCELHKSCIASPTSEPTPPEDARSPRITLDRLRDLFLTHGTYYTVLYLVDPDDVLDPLAAGLIQSVRSGVLGLLDMLAITEEVL